MSARARLAPATPTPGPGGPPGSTPSRSATARALTIIAVAIAVLVGIAPQPPALAVAAPAPPLGAPGQASPGADVYIPPNTINTRVTGGAAPGPWLQELPVAVGPAATRPATPVPGAPAQGPTSGPTSGPSRFSSSPSSLSASAPQDQRIASSPQAAPAAVPVSANAPKPGLGLQPYYPIERRALGDRMELDINTANGNVIVRYRDLSFAGTGLNTSVNHVYNNLATNTGAFGKRWTMPTGHDVGLDLSNPNAIVFQGPTGYLQTYNRNSNGTYVSPPGADTTFVRNGNGTYTLTMKSSKEKWNFDAGGNLTDQVDKNNNKLTFYYNPDGTLACIVDARGAVTQMTGYQGGKVTSFTDPTGASYGPFTYDGSNQLTEFTDRGGNKIYYGYDAAGNLTSIRDPQGNEYRLGYDSSRRITSLAEPNGQTPATTRFAYPAAGQTRETDPNNHTTTYFFDAEGKQTRATDALGHSQSRTYTANFNVATTTSGTNNSVTASYDVANNLVGTKLPTGAATVVGYTDAANPNFPTTSTDEQGNQYSLTYDSRGNPLTARSVTANITEISRTYNSNGTVRDATDGAGNKTTYTYDSVGRLLRVTPPAPRQPINYTYDSLSRLTSVTDGNGVKIEYSYDEFDRVVQVARRNADNTLTVLQQTTFDKNGNKTDNYFGQTTTRFAYNPRNQIVRGTKTSGLLATDTTGYAYDPAGNITEFTDAGGTVRYAYDAANNLVRLTDPTNADTTFRYDDDNNRISTDFPNRTNIQRTYDRSDRTTSIAFNGPTSQFLNNTYAYNKPGTATDTGLITSLRNAQYQTWDMTYDGMNRLTRTQVRNGGAYNYAYDAAGNITNYEGTPYTNNTAEQLTRTGGTTLSYDNQGNQTSDSTGRAMTYSPTNQVTRTTEPGTGPSSGTVDWTYNSVDQTQRDRITHTPGGAGAVPRTTDLTQSAIGITGLTVNGNQRTTAFRDPDGRLIGYKDPAGQVHYVATDFQNTTLASSGPGGTFDAKYEYSPYGRYINAQGTAAGLNNFLYTGVLRGINDRQNLNGARTYDANNGRFTQPDPIGTPGTPGEGSASGIGGPYSYDGNPYPYAADNPVAYTDTTGYCADPTSQLLAEVGVLAGAGELVLGRLEPLGAIGLVTGGISAIRDTADCAPADNLFLQSATAQAQAQAGAFG